ncbi:uroporphyrinogen-III synthase [Alkalihalobacillus sp. TS-13]|uniref:uroporphyrinogen-III synthase n=1 Tax=Alkalihalobacillus sp. TS-13 TaxID=2842455 RepID=UPI001C871FEB|nr:uroporphyrinogen-III synthase [Alkalihalobacillus sp. TS-13]
MDKGLPFSGHKILITRSEEQALPLVHSIEQRGGEAVVIPLLSFQSAGDNKALKRAIHEIEHFQWIVFTSQNTVRYFLRQLQEEGYSIELLKSVKIAAIGKKTLELLEKSGMKVDFMPSRFVAEQFTKEFTHQTDNGERILFPHGNLARSTIVDELTESGGLEVEPVITYETVPNDANKEALQQALKDKDVDILTFTSPSTVHFFFQLSGADETLKDRICACIGPITAEALEEYGVTADIVAEEYTTEGLIASIESYLEGFIK